MKCETSHGSLVYEAHGEGRPLLLLHGWPLDRRAVVGAFEPLLMDRPGWRRVYPDLPGMGETGALEDIRTQDQVLDTLIEFAEKVFGGEPFAVAGISYGGMLAQGLAQRVGGSMTGMAAVVPAMTAKERRRVPSHAVLHRQPVDFSDVPETKEGFEAMAVVQTQEHLDAWKEMILPGIAIADDEFLERLSESYEFSFDLLAPPTSFEAPALFLLGRFDETCGYRDALDVIEHYPRGSFAVLDRAGHCLNFEQPDLFAALILEWLDRAAEYAEMRGTH
jgi:pimeloyl-ACP methyl ester carboxylesterase